ncbi:MAG: serine hydrolase domain-containing protein [Verrucomicrobiota bacterium]
MRAAEDAFRRNFEEGREVGAALCVYRDGEEVLSLHGGFRDAARTVPWDGETLVLVWSATKGPSSACLLHAMEKAGADLETPVAEFWPGFAANGKAGITIGHVMSHRAGLYALDEAVDIMDRESVERAIERQRPLMPVGEGPAYSPRVFGFFLDAMTRRLTDGESLGDYWRRVFAEPMDLDFWIGLPENFHSRVATMIAPRAGETAEADRLFLAAFANANSPTRRSFESPKGFRFAAEMNTARARLASLPATGGIGSAKALAKFYAMLANGGEWQGRKFFREETVAWISTKLGQGFDTVLQRETAFAAGFMVDPVDAQGKKLREVLGPSLSAFGHAGAGGSLAFADPQCKLGFAYVMNRMELGVLPHERCLLIVRALDQ